MDIVGPFAVSRSGKIYWLTLMDAFSKDLELIALPSRKAEVVAKAILVHWICRRGCPRVLLSDNAKEFMGDVMGHLTKALHVDRQSMTAYHHPSAGLIERVHAYAHSIMRSSNPAKLSMWDQWLPFIRFAIFTHEMDASGESPFKVVYGANPTLPGNLTTGAMVLPKNMRQYYKQVQAVMSETRNYFRVQRQKKRIQSRLQRDRLGKRFRDHFRPGEMVYASRPSYTRQDGVRGMEKVVGKFQGPFEIVNVDAHNGVDVLINGVKTHFNVSQITSAPDDPQDREPPAYRTGIKEENPPVEEDHPKVELKQESELPLKLTSDPKPKSTSITREEKGPKPADRFQIIQDLVSKQFYAARISKDDTGLLTAGLYLAAKNGKYHKIWFNPEDGTESKASLSKPKPNWQHWTVTIDETYKLIGPEQPKLSKLKRSLLKKTT
jgi:hypothetical protein